MARDPKDLKRSLRRKISKDLFAHSDLGREGKVLEETDPETIARHVNYAVGGVEGHGGYRGRRAPQSLSAAINGKGSLDRYAEPIVFSQWLVSGGLPERRGRAPDKAQIIRTLGPVLAELRSQKSLHKLGPSAQLKQPARHVIAIRKTAAARRWTEIYGRKLTPSQIDGSLRSLSRALVDYLSAIKDGVVTCDGRIVRESPELDDLVAALGPGLKIPCKKVEKSKAKVTEMSLPTCGSTPVPDGHKLQAVELTYSDNARREEYRTAARANAAVSQLIHDLDVDGSSKPENVKYVLTPSLQIRSHFRSKACVDRLCLLITTTMPTGAGDLQRTCASVSGLPVYVRSLHSPNISELKVGVPVARLQDVGTKGHRFALVVNDATPKTLQFLLEAVKDKHGIQSAPQLHMIEVAVDFHMKNGVADPLALRETLVGLLHRHHWCGGEHLLAHKPQNPRDVDGRQVFGEEKNSWVRHLVQRRAVHDTVLSDRNISEVDVRKRILEAVENITAPSSPSGPIFLNSTVYVGDRYSPVQISIQHKIADRRLSEKKKVLTADERRPRVEVMLSDTERLAERGLRDVRDIGACSFRALTKGMLSFWLPSSSGHLEDVEREFAILASQGVYGSELYHRACVYESVLQRRIAGETGLRLPKAEGTNLVAWKEMNKLVGEALDGLSRQWRTFEP